MIVGLGIAVPAAAEDPPAKPARAEAKPRAKITSPLLLALVGSWDVTLEFKGDKKVRKGTYRCGSVLDGTALVEEYTIAGTAVRRLAVIYVGLDGASVSGWSFGSMAPGEVTVLTGRVGPEAVETRYSSGGTTASTRLERRGDGLVFTSSPGTEDETVMTLARAVKEVPPQPNIDVLAIGHPFVLGVLGDYGVTGSFEMGDVAVTQEGTAAIRLAVGGVFVLTDYEVKVGNDRKFGLGVAGLTDDKKTLKYWWFSDHFSEPTLVSGELSEKEWKGRAETSPHGPFDMTWTKTDAGFDLKAAFANGASMSETYTKK